MNLLVWIILGGLNCQEVTLAMVHARVELRPHGNDDGVVGVARGEGDAARATWRGRRRRGPASFHRGGEHVAERTEQDSY